MTATFLWAVLHKLWDFSPVLAPTIVIYLIDAPFSLKVWIGAQHAPKFPDELEPPKRKGILENLRIVHPPWVADMEWALLASFLLIALGVDVFVGDSTRKKFILYGILVLPGMYSFSRLPWRPTSVLVTRTKKGVPMFVQMMENSTVVTSLQLLLGWGICSTALLWGSSTVVERLCTTVLYASFLHIYILASVSRASKERGFLLHTILAGALSFMLICATMIMLLWNAIHGPSAEESESPDRAPKSNKFNPTSIELGVSLTHSWICFEFVSLCYRMDYAFASQSGEGKPTPKLQRPKGASPGDKKFHTVRVLASFRPVFDKPYYKASIGGVVSSALFVASLGVRLHWLQYKMTGYYLNLSSPIICMVVLAVAYRRGEVRKVLAYGEGWLDVPEGDPFMSSAEDESSESAPDLEFCDNFTEKDLEDEKYQVA